MRWYAYELWEASPTPRGLKAGDQIIRLDVYQIDSLEILTVPCGNSLRAAASWQQSAATDRRLN